MRVDLSAYPHEEAPAPRVQVAIDYAGTRKSVRLDVFGECFPARRMGNFRDGFLIDSNMRIWDAGKGALLALRMVMCVHCEIEADPFAIVLGRCHLQFAVDVLDGCPDVHVLVSQEVNEYLSAIRKARQEKPNLSLFRDVELMPYQQEALSWMRGCAAARLGGLLALDPGLGKTVVSLAFVADLQSRIPYAQTLVICPASVIGHWLDHARRLVPSLKTVVISGQQTERVEQIRSGEWDLAITSVGCAQRDAGAWAGWRLSCLIFDEITAAKNRSSKIRASVRRYRAECRFGLSGTPILNSVKDLHAIFSALYPGGYLGTVREFNRTFYRPIEEAGSTFAAETLRRLVAPCMYRKLKEEVLDLPKKSEVEIRVTLHPKQMALYRQEEMRVLRRLRTMTDEQYAVQTERVKVFGAISRLRQLAVTGHAMPGFDAPSTKVDAAIDLACTLLSEGQEKIVVFTLFVAGVAGYLQDKLSSRGVSSLRLVGDTSVPERGNVIERFANDPECRVIVISSAAGQGIDLQAANCAIVLTPWWNHGVIQQAVDRVHRFGQTKEVAVYHLIAEGTIEERMLELQERKWDISGMVLRQSEKPISRMSRTELIDLLGGSEATNSSNGVCE